MAILNLFGQQHQLKDKDTPQEQQELMELIATAEQSAQEIPLLNPKERSYVLLLLKILQQQQEHNISDNYWQNYIDRVQELCDKIDDSVEKSRHLIHLEA